ncbi:Rieske 2Fe-2S domain-containing protein [Paludisphaera mucosa]|uniref:Rieske 2Fe-2S domain-containing protein n=1 Tax=Paludisphaera mucosa TaxID=3030827 RepID=A0ABT6FDB7_9BACT|nr:Rieske 2Fe-2S domain-containing protein [Paludisphaera mucosa]MDG3005571.1 Rieske 2Fe-2S domain-containing protein [Paludisphaera mucosa]
MSVQEKLAAARSGNSAKPAGEPSPAVAASTAPAPAGPPKTMSVKEKLAAARAGGTTKHAPKPATADQTDAPPAASPAVGAMSVTEKLAAARAGGAGRPAPAPAATSAAPAAKPGGMSVKQKLAAARGVATAPETATVETASSPTPVPAQVPTAAPRVLPPLAEMTDPRDLAEALRRAGAKKDQEAAARPAVATSAAAAAVPARPRREDVLGERPDRSQVRVDRRGLFVYATWWVVVGWLAFAAALALLSAMMIRYLFPNADAEPPSTVKVGLPTDYEPGDVSERFKDQWGFWIVRNVDDRGRDVIYALQTYCTHLGCPPSWLPGEQKFKCPCHGSGFYKDGANFEGPAPRPLERYKIGLADDGQIVVDKGQTFRKDLDQWSDPDSFLAV